MVNLQAAGLGFFSGKKKETTKDLRVNTEELATSVKERVNLAYEQYKFNQTLN